MESSYSMECKDGTAKIVLTGRLDAASAPKFQEKLRELSAQKISNLVFFAKDLEYISSAGLRVIIFAKQKLGADAKLYLIGAPAAVLNVIKMSGLDNFMIVQDQYPG
ncbi:MAG TPA: STAS domain-containing protein [Elusimicrobiota bacterium]|nr:STAS domain-containing protein [Elusimicrobiota bacterium]